MVKTEGDVMDVHPLDRMEMLEDIKQEKKTSLSKRKKDLEELEKKKLKEIEELDLKKKKELEELERKRRELEDLEKKKVKEIEETDTLIEKSFQDLMRHKRRIIQEEEESQKSKNLESLAQNAPAQDRSAPQANYGRFFEELQAPTKLYQVTNTKFYSNLVELRNKAARGELTEGEEQFVDRLKDKFSNFSDNSEYMKNDQNNYVRRSMSIIDEIANYKSKTSLL
jgi:hypothetical protein